MTLEGDEAIALAALFVAALSLAFSIFEGYQTRLHNRKSLLPHLVLSKHLGRTRSRENLGLTLSNDGPGPALITSCFIWDDQQGFGNDHEGAWGEVIGAYQLALPDISWTVVSPDGSMPAGGMAWLLYIPRDDENFGFAGELGFALESIGVRVDYESYYGDKKVAYWNYSPKADRVEVDPLLIGSGSGPGPPPNDRH